MKITVTTGGEPVMLMGGALYVDSIALIQIEDADDGFSWHVDATYDQQLERVVAKRVAVSRPGDGSEVTSKRIRDVRVQEALRSALGSIVHVRFGEAGQYEPAGEALSRIEPAAGRPRAQVIEDALLLHRMATIANLPPIKMIADRLGVSISTATRMIYRTTEPDGDG